MNTPIARSAALKLGWLLLAFFSAPMTHAATAAAVAPGAEQQVLAVNDEMIAAANRLDVDAFFSYILDTDRGMIVQNGTIFRTRREAYEAVKRGMQGVVKLERRINDPRVTLASPDVAVLVGEGKTIATLQDGRQMDNHFAVSLVFVRSGDTWKLLHGHYSTAGMR